MLLLNPKEDAVWKTHEESGASFLIAPADSATQNDIEARAKKAHTEQGGEYFSHLARITATERIKDWKGVGSKAGALPCTPDNLASLARAHENTLMPWLIREVRNLAHFIADEETAAKNA